MGGADDSLVFIVCRAELTDPAFLRERVRTGTITRLSVFDGICIKRDWEILTDG